MRKFETLLIDTEDQVTTITLNRPEAKNAMSPQLHFDMRDALSELRHDENTRVLVLTGTGDSFCAGQDLKRFFYEAAKDPTLRVRAREASSEWRMRLLRLFPKPTIAAVNGFCFGGAMGVVTSCDIVIAAEEATFGFPEINWGVFPGSTLPKVIPELMPFRDALYYSLTGDRFDGKKAAELRFANFAVPRSQLRQATLEVAAKLKEKEPWVLRVTKEVFKLGMQMNYEEMDAWTEAKGNELKLLSGEGWKRGVEQFMEHKYKPALESYKWEEK